MNPGDLLVSSGVVHTQEKHLNHSDGTHIVYLQVGDVHTATEPTEITTILGSSIAICLWDPALRIGGMNHFMLAEDRGSASESGRYAEWATRTLVDRLLSSGSTCERLQAKIFGGATVMNIGSTALGEKNIQAARQRLSSRGIAIVAEDVGGCHGRKLLFRTDTGFSMVKTL